MSSYSLAADAAEFEHPEYDEPLDVGDLAALETADPMIARDALLAIAKLEREAGKVRELRAAVVDRYDSKLEKISVRVAHRRALLAEYVRRFGKVSIPDAGAAYETTKNKGGKLRLADAAAFLEWVENDPECGELIVKTIDVKQTFENVVDELNLAATKQGHVIETEAGMITAIPGVEALAEEKTLAVRQA